MKYERLVVKVSDSEDLQAQILAHTGYRFAGSIPWGDRRFLVFEREYTR